MNGNKYLHRAQKRTPSGTTISLNGTLKREYGLVSSKKDRQRSEVPGVRWRRTNAGLEEHPEPGDGVQPLNSAGTRPGHLRKVLVGPRPEPRLLLRAERADRGHPEPGVPDRQRPVRHLVLPTGRAGDSLLK